jgi:hypothetical protein
MTLDDLAPRICVIPLHGGHSTLTTKIGRACGLTPIHLDPLDHIPKLRDGYRIGHRTLYPMLQAMERVGMPNPA